MMCEQNSLNTFKLFVIPNVSLLSSRAELLKFWCSICVSLKATEGVDKFVPSSATSDFISLAAYRFVSFDVTVRSDKK